MTEPWEHEVGTPEPRNHRTGMHGSRVPIIVGMDSASWNHLWEAWFQGSYLSTRPHTALHNYRYPQEYPS